MNLEVAVSDRVGIWFLAIFSRMGIFGLLKGGGTGMTMGGGGTMLLHGPIEGQGRKGPAAENIEFGIPYGAPPF